MISVIVCSYNLNLYQNLANNVAETVGVPCEIIRIDNSSNTYSVCSAYNEGASKAKYDVLCFAHEDIQMKTQDWGKKIIEILASDSKIGLVGVAGGSYKAFAPSPCVFGNSAEETVYINLTQSYKYQKSPERQLYFNPKGEKLSNVVAVDGVWFCTTKTIAQQTRFDEETFRGFHCYDVDFSLSVLQNYRVVVTFEILLMHLSEGRYDINWIEDVLKLHRKWDHLFPINLENLSLEMQKAEEIKANKEFYQIMLSSGYKPAAIIKALKFNSPFQPLSRDEISDLKFNLYKYTAKRMVKQVLNKTRFFKYKL